jgi:hypothetical protein
MSVLYPVAASAEEALSRPCARAAREREAATAAAAEVAFVTELAGPAFATREAALDAYSGRLDDERRTVGMPPEDRWCALVELAADRPATVWRLSVSYWRIGGAARPTPLDQARAVRRNAEATALPAQALRALARQPLQAVRPQQPLDIGLFETRPPEAPHIVMPDE